MGEADKNAWLVEERLRSGYKLILSRSVEGVVIPRAVSLAQATVKRSRFDLRHLLFALLEHNGPEWRFLERSPSDDELARARDYIVDQIGQGKEPGERMIAWRTALNAVPPSNGQAPVAEVSTDEPGAEKDDRISAQRDEPAQSDQLGRDAFAEVIAARLVEVHAAQKTATEDTDRAFLIHLDGSWGSGKSSILNFVQQDLRRRDPAWLIVEFNAWREQRNLPPWWALIGQFVRQVRGQLVGVDQWKFRAIWALWTWRSRYVSVIVAVIVLVVGLFLFRPDWTSTQWHAKDVLALITTFGAVAAVIRSAQFGSAANAKALDELRGDPYAPVMAVFNRLVRCARRPILVIVDDIDRCDGAYVVGLLENIQTMLRAEPISYIVAGDRKWITASFEKKYADFRDTLATPGRPLGHLFLDKLFQLSVSVPRIGRTRLERYWQSLLLNSGADDPAASQDAKRAEAISLVGESVTQESLQRKIDEVKSDPILAEAVRAEAARRITSPAANKVLESRYAGYAAMLDPNPRAMKRLVNAIGIGQAVLFLEGRSVDPDVLGRWTVLEMRWPDLAAALASNRGWLDAEPVSVEAPFDALLGSRDVQTVLAGVDKRPPLDSAALNLVLGDV